MGYQGLKAVHHLSPHQLDSESLAGALRGYSEASPQELPESELAGQVLRLWLAERWSKEVEVPRTGLSFAEAHRDTFAEACQARLLEVADSKEVLQMREGSVVRLEPAHLLAVLPEFALQLEVV